VKQDKVEKIMDDWDSVSSDTPPDSTIDAWDTVSTPGRPPAPAQRRRPPDNLVIEGDAFQSAHLSGQDIPITPSLNNAQPQQDVVVKPRSQPDLGMSAFSPGSYTPVPSPLVKRTAQIIVFIAVALVLVIGGFGVFQGISIHNANVAATATVQAQDTAVVIQAKATATAQAVATVTPLVPTIISVSQFLPAQNQEIIISGNGFGTLAPYTNTTSNYLLIEDVTNSDWGAGWNGDWVTVSVSVWTDNQIVITGFAGSYGTNGWVFRTGDNVVISVWNPQSGTGGTGQAQFSLVVAG
jgi:hypothetical protein